MRKSVAFTLVLALLLALLAGCGSGKSSDTTSTDEMPSSSTEGATDKTPIDADSGDRATEVLPDGIYSAAFETDSSMFRANETCDGKGTLTVANGEMTIPVSLMSKKILNLFPGTAEDALKDGAVWLEPTVDTVTYSDGLSEEVYGFDIPVPAIGEEFDLALVGTKGTWYDHKVSVQNPEPLEDAGNGAALIPEDGTYTCNVVLEGGSGRATVQSPARLRIENGEMFATIVWSSSNYDYMKVAEQKYEPVNTEGNSTFEIPVSSFDIPLTVVADTVAMSTPHEVTYTLTFDSASVQQSES